MKVPSSSHQPTLVAVGEEIEKPQALLRNSSFADPFLNQTVETEKERLMQNILDL